MQVKKVKINFKVKQRKKSVIHKKSSIQKETSNSIKDNDKTSNTGAVSKISNHKEDIPKLQSSTSTDPKQKSSTKDHKKKTIRKKDQYKKRRTSRLSEYYMKKIESINHPTFSDVKTKSSNALINHLNKINETKDEASANVNLLSYAKNEAKLYNTLSKVIRADINKKRDNTRKKTSRYKKVQKKKHILNNTKYGKAERININTLRTKEPKMKFKASRCKLKKRTYVISHKGSKKSRSSCSNKHMRTYIRQKLKGEKPSEKLTVIIKNKLKKSLKTMVNAVLRYAAGGLIAFLIQIVITTVPVVVAVAILYNSPLALFLPALEEGETVTDVLTAYEDEFYQKIDVESKNLNDCSYAQLIFLNSNNQEKLDNYYDVLCVYMIKHGFGSTATIMNDKTKKQLLETFNHMCRYTVSYDTKIIETTAIERDDEGNEAEVTKEEVIVIKVIEITLLDINDIINEESMGQDEILLLQDMMNQMKPSHPLSQ